VPYVEFPADEIIDCHFKKKDPGDPGDGGEGTHLCGEWGYDFPGDGFYVIYYDPPPPGASGEFRHSPRLIPYRVRRELIFPRLISPRDDQVWAISLPYYLMESGIYFNPYADPALDAAQGRTPLRVPAVAYEISWSFELRADPPPFPGQVPCTFLTGHGMGLGMTNAIIDPEFNIFKPNMPTSPNYGPAPVTYDVASDGSGILTTMGYANIITTCDDQDWVIANCPENVGCFNQTWSGDSHFNIKAICAGPATPSPAPHRRRRVR